MHDLEARDARDGRRTARRVFHSGDELGSTIAVSCDMCHPDAANTHPETYPKFQPQLGRVALLRDMINWCIEHPVRGTKLAPDDPQDARARGLHHGAAQGEDAELRRTITHATHATHAFAHGVSS